MKHYIFIIICLTIAQLVAADFNFVADNSFLETDFIALGASKANSSGIKITEEGDPMGSVILYNQKLPLANGFTTSFVLDITNCDIGYGGADGLAFVMFPDVPPRSSYFSGGSGIGLTALSNFAAIPFILGADWIGICALNSSTDLGGIAVSIRDNTVLCEWNSTVSAVLANLRCSGPHTLMITFSPPNRWKITIDGDFTFSFTRNTTEILDWNYQAYVGFAGGVAAGYMNQYVTSWQMTISPGCLGVCDPMATCIVDTTTTCNCPSGYQGDGTTCAPVDPPGVTVVPILECFEDLGSGSYRAHFGYQNDEAVPIVISEGANNQLIGSTTNNLLTTFNPGRSSYYPLTALKHEFSNATIITWHLTDYDVTLNVNDKSKLCPEDLFVKLKFYTTQSLDLDPIIDQLTQELQVSYGRIKVSNFTTSSSGQLTKKRSVTVGDLEVEISATNSTTGSEPSAADTVLDLIGTAENTTRINEIINTDQASQTNDFIDVKTLPTGVETVGQQVVPPTGGNGPTAQNTPTQNTPIKTSGASTLFNCFVSIASIITML